MWYSPSKEVAIQNLPVGSHELIQQSPRLIHAAQHRDAEDYVAEHKQVCITWPLTPVRACTL